MGRKAPGAQRRKGVKEILQRKRRKSFDIGFYVLVLVALVLAYYALYGVNTGTSITYAQAKQLFVQERVETFQVSGNTLTMTVRDSSVSSGRVTAKCQLYSVELFHDDLGELIDQQSTRRASSWTTTWIPPMSRPGGAVSCSMWC